MKMRASGNIWSGIVHQEAFSDSEPFQQSELTSAIYYRWHLSHLSPEGLSA